MQNQPEPKKTHTQFMFVARYVKNVSCRNLCHNCRQKNKAADNASWWKRWKNMFTFVYVFNMSSCALYRSSSSDVLSLIKKNMIGFLASQAPMS